MHGRKGVEYVTAQWSRCCFGVFNVNHVFKIEAAKVGFFLSENQVDLFLNKGDFLEDLG